MRALIGSLLLCAFRVFAVETEGASFLATRSNAVVSKKKMELQKAVEGLAVALGRELGDGASSERAGELLNQEIEKVAARDPVRGALLDQYFSRVPPQAILLIPVKTPVQPENDKLAADEAKGAGALASSGYSQSTVFESDGNRAVQRTTVCKGGRCEERTSVGRLAPQQQETSALEDWAPRSRPRSSVFDWMWGMGDTLQTASDTFGTDQVGSMFDDLFPVHFQGRHGGLLDDDILEAQPGRSWSKSMTSSSRSQNGHTWTNTKKCVNGVCDETSMEDGKPGKLDASKLEMPARTAAKHTASDIAVKAARASSDSDEEQQATSQSTSVSKETVIENGKMVTKITKCVNGKCTETTEVGEASSPGAVEASPTRSSSSKGPYGGMVF